MAKYKAYTEYKDSGVEWLGDIPSHWNVAKTMRYFKIAMGQTILKEQLEDDGEWPVYSATEGNSYFGYVSSPQVKLSVGDLVIPARGNSIGSVKLVSGKSTTTQTTIYCKHLTQAIRLLQERRTALISAAVTGKIDVRDWVAPNAQDVEEPQEAIV